MLEEAGVHQMVVPREQFNSISVLLTVGHTDNFPVKYRVFESDASYSAHEFRLDAVAYSYENSNLYLSFGGNKEIPVGTISNCDHDGNVEYAWLGMQSDGTYNFTIREVFTGIPGERFREFKFDKNGRRIK